MAADDEFMPLAGKRIYLSGPMTGYDRRNHDAFAEAERFVRSLGATDVYNPVTHSESVDWTTREMFMHYDLGVLLTCDLMVQLEDWDRSWGAARELEVSITSGIPVVTLHDLREDKREWSAEPMGRCPECGGEPVIAYDTVRQDGEDVRHWYAECPGCGFNSDGIRLLSRSDASRVWNFVCGMHGRGKSL